VRFKTFTFQAHFLRHWKFYFIKMREKSGKGRHKIQKKRCSCTEGCADGQGGDMSEAAAPVETACLKTQAQLSSHQLLSEQ
jgi:hypothetical protein